MSEENETKKTDEISPEPKPEKKTTKEIVVGEDRRIKELETRVSDLQKLRQEDKGLIDSLSEMVSAARKIPSARKPGKSLLDEVDEFLGFGSEPPATNTVNEPTK